jgi:hypothetical protein
MMKRFINIFTLIIFVLHCSPAAAKTSSSSKRAAKSVDIMEVPNDTKWLKGKRFYCDPSEKFIVAVKSKAQAKRILSSAVHWNDKIYKYFGVGHLSVTPVCIVACENEAELKSYSRQSKFPNLAICHIEDGEETRMIYLTSIDDDLDSNLAHELAHLCVRDIYNSKIQGKPFKLVAPPCINEGVAMHFASAAEKEAMLESWRDAPDENRFISMRRLLLTVPYAWDDDRLVLFYFHSASLVDFILCFPDGKKRLVEFLQRYDSSRENPYELFKEVFCKKVSSSKFQKSWEKYIINKYSIQKRVALKNPEEN